MVSELAIIIPYYKLTFFKETLESLAGQSDKRFHVYIGNDASPEDPADLLEEYYGTFNFTYKRFKDNMGGKSLTAQWERCIAMIQGEEWFQILGDDDILGSRVVEIFHTNISEARLLSNVLRYSTQLMGEKSPSPSKVWLQPKLENAFDSYFRKLDGENRGSLSEFIFRSASYTKYKFRNFPLAWCADDFAVLDFSENMPIYSFNEETVYVRMSNANISGSTDNLDQKEKAVFQSIKALLKDYVHRIPRKRRELYIKLYDQEIMGAPIIYAKDFLRLQYLTLRYVNIRLAIQQWKTLIYKFVFSK